MSTETRSFIGRQPILDVDERIVAFELLYRASADALSAEYGAQSAAASRVIANTFAAMGPDAVIGDCLGFINVTAAVLKSDVLEALPADRVVIEILETVEDDRDVQRRCRELRERGFQLALDDFVLDDPRSGLLELVDLVKVDLMAVRRSDLKKLVRRLRRHPVELLAEKVESRAEFELCRELGFKYFQGYFFARPTVIEGSRVDPARRLLLELIGKLQSEADSMEIVELMKLHLELELNLLRLVNSAALSKPAAIESVEDAVHYLGRRHLQRWITILLFAGSDSDGIRSPLLQAAAHRGRLMETLIGEILAGAASSQAERAFLVGMLSFVDALLGRPRAELVGGLPLHEEVSNALLDGSGALGQLLGLAEELAEAPPHDLDARLSDLGIGWGALQRAEDAAFLWVRDLQRV